MQKGDEGTFLAELGELVRIARVARKLTQQRAAREAGVSRRQWALLEAGGNVSVAFLLKVAASLDLTTIPLRGAVTLVRGAGEYDGFDLMRTADEFEALVARLRAFALTSVLPPSERYNLKDTLAVRAFVDRQTDLDAHGLQALERALHTMTTETAAPPAVETQPVARKVGTHRRRRKA